VLGDDAMFYPKTVAVLLMNVNDEKLLNDKYPPTAYIAPPIVA